MPGDRRAGDRFAGVRALADEAIAARATPAVVVEVGRRKGLVWREAFGTLTWDQDARPCAGDTVFDLASLTKVIATATIAMRQVERDLVALDAPVASLSASWRGDDRDAVTVRQLLDHSSGLPAHARLFEHLRGAEAFERAIGRLPLETAPGTTAAYSDVGFMLLGFVLQRTGGAPLDEQFAAFGLDSADEPLTYRPGAGLRSRTAPTEFDPWRNRLLVGEVHDENAFALGGVAAHAGLFGAAGAVGRFARLVLETFVADTPLGTPEGLARFVSRSAVPGSTRALGWDTMKPTSSCGRRMSPAAIGHTGFTGTSLWIDPGQDVYVVLLANRVHPSREPNRWAPRRAPIHDAIIDALDD
ncbi:MAG: serine hydrolase domain-containing protein [Vicinamibacterales bacterium]